MTFKTIRAKITNDLNKFKNTREFKITRARRTTENGIVQVNGNLLFALNFKTQEWKVFDRLLKDWIGIGTMHPYFNQYIVPILDFFRDSFPGN
ncbi:MAG: hypothetical protein JW891_03250 [Candidatus Lokiarchaeota archaeon]|nr:hypothetical protein [Candidatus Lokiarchaeota archaeon]